MTDDPIERVKASDGDLVLDFDSRVGARPYARYVDGEWELMSLSHVPTPDYGLDDADADGGVNTEVHLVDLEPDPDDHPEDKLREIAKQPRYPDDDVDGWPGVQVIDYEDSPFARSEEIPARDDIVRHRGCTACGNMYREYIPDPQDACPYCGTAVDADGSEA